MKKFLLFFAALTLSVGLWGAEGITVNVTVPSGTPACYFYGEMSGNQFAEMTKVDETHYTINFPDATSIGWGYRFVWESGNWSTGNGDPSGDIKVEPIGGVINVEIKAWLSSPGTMCKYTEYENWQIKYGNKWEWTANMTKVEEGLFMLEILWEGTGINVKSDDNPIKKDWYDLKDPDVVIGEEVIAPVTVDVYLRVIDDEHLRLGIGVDPGTDPTSIDPTLLNENANVNKFIHNGQLVIRKDGKKFNVGGVEIR